MIDKILGFVFDSYDELAEALHRGQVSEGYCVQEGEIRFMNIELLEYHEKLNSGFYDSEEAISDNAFVFHGSDNTAVQGEPVDDDSSEQDNTAVSGTCETCKYCNIYFRCDCHSSHLFNRDLKYDYSCIFYIDKRKYEGIFRSGG